MGDEAHAEHTSGGDSRHCGNDSEHPTIAAHQRPPSVINPAADGRRGASPESAPTDGLFDRTTPFRRWIEVTALTDSHRMYPRYDG